MPNYTDMFKTLHVTNL